MSQKPVQTLSYAYNSGDSIYAVVGVPMAREVGRLKDYLILELSAVVSYSPFQCMAKC